MKKIFLKSFCARCLTLLVLALLSTNLAWGADFVKVSSTNDLVAGSEYIIVSGSTYAATTTMNGTKGVALGQVTITGEVVTSGENTAIFELEGETGAWKLKTGTNYLSANGTENSTKFVTTTGKESTFTISFVSQSGSLNLVTTTDSKRCLRANGTTDIRFYSGETTSNGKVVYLYKKKADVPVTGVTLNKNELPLNVGATETLTATVAPDDATNKNVTWSSDKEGVATVSESGEVTAVAAGTAIITVKSVADDTKSASCEVTVSLNKLATPANLAATNIASTSATLTWDEVANASSYKVYVTDADAYEETFTPTTNSLLVEDLAASTAYTWTVKAIGDNMTYANSDESAASEFTTSALPTVAYTVTFNGNEHGTPASESITEESAGAGITLPNCTPNEGYQFVGWATTNTATEADAGVAGATYYPTENITLYAVYNEVYTINYMVNGVNTGAQVNVVKGTALVFPTVSAPDADHVFCGWVTTAIEGTTDTKPGFVTTTGLTATADATYYAVYAHETEGAAQTIFSEDFDACEGTGGNTGGWSGTIASATIPTSITGWTFTKGNAADQCAKFGTGSAAGSAKTPTIEFTGKATLTFRAGAWSGDAKTLNITTTSGKVTPASVTLADAAFTSYEIVITGATENPQITFAAAQASKNRFFLDDVVVKTAGAPTYSNYCTTVVTKTLESITLSGEYPTEFWKGDAFSHEGMIVTAHYNDGSTKDVTASAAFTGYDMTSAGEQTVTVTYDTKSTTYNITVKTIANTPATAYTTAQAKKLIDAGNDLGTEVYVKGTISKIDSYNGDYNSITYWLDDDAFEVYSGLLSKDKEQFSSKNDLSVGEFVIICGKLKKFNSTYELNLNNYLVNYTSAPMSITSAKLSTFIAPFPVTIPDGVQAYTAVASADAIEYTEVENVIPACTPVVLYKVETYSKICKGSSLATEDSYQVESLVGTLVKLENNVPTNVGGAPTYLLQNNSGVVGFYKTNSEKNYTLNANRAYLVGVNSVNAKDFFGFDDNNPTGISEINVSKFPVEGIFDINGRKLAVPQKGINIINGVKVIVK